jgi:hypothetical protein
MTDSSERSAGIKQYNAIGGASGYGFQRNDVDWRVGVADVVAGSSI